MTQMSARSATRTLWDGGMLVAPQGSEARQNLPQPCHRAFEALG
jgi:hypothetical protein